MRNRSAERGFTLIEVTVVVALIGVLAAVALPTWASSTRKSKRETEVRSFMAELKLREDAHMSEKAGYLSTGTSETDTFPTTPSHTSEPLGALPDSWVQLHMRPPGEAACTYVVITGTPAASTGTIATSLFAYVKPTDRDWYYVLARCYDDDDDTHFFSSSSDGAIVEAEAP